MEKASFTKEEFDEYSKIKNSTYFQTELNFLKQHKGYRPKKLHLFLGIPSGGKSTLRNTLIKDFVINNPDKAVGLYLSEESCEDFKSDATMWAQNKILERVILVSEQDQGFQYSNVDDYLEELQEKIIRLNCDIIIFDNITTMKFYSRFADQEKISLKLKELASVCEIPVVIFCHTRKDIQKNHKQLISVNDLRGSGTLANISEFAYVMQMIQSGETLQNFLFIEKHRGQEVSQRNWSLFYMKEKQIYLNSFSVDFEKIKETFNNRNKL